MDAHRAAVDPGQGGDQFGMGDQARGLMRDALAQGFVTGRGGVELCQQRLTADPVVRYLLALAVQGAARQYLVPIACHATAPLMCQEEPVYASDLAASGCHLLQAQVPGQISGRISRAETK